MRIEGAQHSGADDDYTAGMKPSRDAPELRADHPAPIVRAIETWIASTLDGVLDGAAVRRPDGEGAT